MGVTLECLLSRRGVRHGPLAMLVHACMNRDRHSRRLSQRARRSDPVLQFNSNLGRGELAIIRLTSSGDDHACTVSRREWSGTATDAPEHAHPFVHDQAFLILLRLEYDANEPKCKEAEKRAVRDATTQTRHGSETHVEPRSLALSPQNDKDKERGRCRRMYEAVNNGLPSESVYIGGRWRSASWVFCCSGQRFAGIWPGKPTLTVNEKVDLKSRSA